LPGSLFVAYIGSQRRGLLLLATSFMSGATLLLLASFPYYVAGAAVMLFMGLGASPQRALKESLAMDAVDDRYRGRVISVLMLSIALSFLGVLPLGLAADHLGARATLVIMGGTITAMTLIVLMTQRVLREAQ
jgi:predicted MFS family arabinose efflux permease